MHTLLTIFLIGTYIQGTFFSSTLPGLDGNELHFPLFSLNSLYQLLMWGFLCVAMFVVVHLFKSKYKFKLFTFVSLFLLVFWGINILFEYLDLSGGESNTSQFEVTYNDINEVSTTDNMILFILDAVDGKYVQSVLDENKTLRNELSDFTFYPNTMSCYPYTKHSVPQIITGEFYENDKDYSTYLKEAYETSPILSYAKKNNYKTSIYTDILPHNDINIAKYCSNILPLHDTKDNDQDIQKLQYNLVAYKYIFYPLKQYFASSTSNSNATDSNDYDWNTSNDYFYHKINRSPLMKTEQKCFKIIHLDGAHLPFTFKLGNDSTDVTYKSEVQSSLELMCLYIKRLKEAGVYDNSRIIIASDHGFEESNYYIGRQNATLLAKGLYEHHTLRSSDISVSFSNLQTALLNLMNTANSDQIFENCSSTKRRYLLYEYLNENFVEQYQTGYATNLSTLKSTGVLYPEYKQKITFSHEKRFSSLTNLIQRLIFKLYHTTNSLAYTIIIITLLTKLLLLPLTIWSYINSVKMVKIQPEINYIHAQYWGEPQQISKKQTTLFKQVKYHPALTLVPLIMQLLLLGLVIDLIKGLIMIPTVDTTFYTIDLATAASDSLGYYTLSPFLAGLSAWLMCSSQNQSNVIQMEQSKVNKYSTMILSVLLSIYLGFFTSTGVVLYWILSNLYTILQTYVFNAIYNPKKHINYEELEKSIQKLNEVKLAAKSTKKLSYKDKKREAADYKRFFSTGNKHLVFYSESDGFYKYYKGTIEYLLTWSDLPIHYVTSDPNDQIFELEQKHATLHAYFIGEKKLIPFMMKMDADIVVMTMPDLENYHIKRSYVRKDIEYIHFPHGVDSSNLTLRTGGLDHFDTIFCPGKHIKEEVAKTEELYHLPKKKLVECGYSLIDEMIEAYSNSSKQPNTLTEILIAPSWQNDNILDSCLETILDILRDNTNYNITVRPHPQEVKNKRSYINVLLQRYKETSNVTIQTSFSANDTVFSADLLITDWSAIAYEYSYTTKKPVLFINTPMKIMNPEWEKINVTPFNIWTREIIGRSVDVDQLDRNLITTVNYLLTHQSDYEQAINTLISEYLYNCGNSSKISAHYLFDEIIKKIEAKKERDDLDEKNI